MDNYLNQVLGNRYEIKEIIGVGGMSVVYKAFDRVDNRTVAVKILKEEYLANEEFRRRFKNESKAIAVLSHPNIVKVYDVSFGEKLQYIIMEHVEGITLKEYIQRQKIVEWKEAVHLVVQILRALQHAHDKGIIHRDVKPQNILLLPNASIKVTDFGIARFNRGEIKSVADSSAIGSVHYVSPEQARGDYTDEKSDIYSVGVVLYEMLTGRLPFDSDTDESVAMMQLKDDAIRPSELNAAIPIGLEQITMRAMQKNPSDRYQSAAEFLRDLDEFKHNPQIKFDYNFFVDKTPTKYIARTDRPIPAPAKSVEKPAEKKEKEPAPVKAKKTKKPKTKPEDDYEDFDDDDDDDDEDEGPRSATIPILVSIAVALVLIVGVIVLSAFGDTIKEVITGDSSSESSTAGFLEKLDLFGLFSKDKIEVPNFLNMKYDEIREKYPDLIFEDPPQTEYNSSYEDGHVCAQSPEAGTMVSEDTVIRLTVASSGEMIRIRDVAGLSTQEAEELLVRDGLEVVLVAQVDETKKEGEVLNTMPGANTYIPRNDIVYVYYASSKENVNSLRAPNVVGYELAAAKAKIEATGLKVGTVTQGASAASLKGLVISQTPNGLSPVNAGTYVNLVVGTGVPSANTVQVKINLPDMDTNTTGTVRTFLNNNAYDSIDGVVLDGSSYTITYTGTGSSNPFKIYIDSVLIYSGNIDFSTTPPSISDLKSYDFAKKDYVPNVVGMSASDASAVLNAKSFTRVHTRYEASATVPEGFVISQSPAASETEAYSTDSMVTIVISSGVNGEAAETTAAAPAEAESDAEMLPDIG